ncbi:MAG: hypothetical protein DRI24_18040 [Deltaproteobacteria bacterium]|nr:MAG: hypothetical protein DRI24_18040 [Deltaproteobacteria bacterium]
MEIKKAPAVKIKFEKSPDHKIHPVSGIWGGATPQGDILCHFFVEHQELPEILELEFDVKSGKTVETGQKEEKIYLREILTSLVIRPDIAMSIGTWLISKAEAIKKSRPLNTQEAKRTIQ